MCPVQLLEELNAPNREVALLVMGRRLNIPVTVHVAVGTDIIHMHPGADGAALGRASFNDFRLFAGVIAGLSGGVYLNVGSAVVLPEVFLKVLTIAQDLGADLRDYVTVNIDMIAHYRCNENVVRRPAGVAAVATRSSAGTRSCCRSWAMPSLISSTDSHQARLLRDRADDVGDLELTSTTSGWPGEQSWTELP
jgi:hypothetical protein